MTDPRSTDTPLDAFNELPIQPTGSGVADLEIAYRQMKLFEAAGPDGADGAVEDAAIAAMEGSDAVPTEESAATAESAAHPS